MKNKLRIGLIGAGGIVRNRHFPNFLKRDDLEIVVVCNSRPESSEKFAREFDIPETAHHWQNITGRDDLDVIWIGTTPYMHKELTVAALEAGKHVFCQARMAMNLREGREMLAAAQAHPDLLTMLCPPPHGMKHGSYFKRLLRDGYVGRPLQFHFQSLSVSFANPDAEPHWRQRKDISGQNMLSVGIHAEVLNDWLGKARRIQAQTAFAKVLTHHAEVTVPDIVQVIGEWENGMSGSLEWSGVTRFAPGERLEVYGNEGTLVYDFENDQILGAQKGASELHPLEVPDEYIKTWNVENEFFDAVRTGEGKPEPSFETGVAYMEFLEAVHLSAREHRAVELPLP